MLRNSKVTLYRISFVLWTVVILWQCQSKNDAPDVYDGMDSRTAIRMRQYMVQGKSLYQMHCQNCHGDTGQGLGELIPPLAKSDYLMSDIDRALCIIKNGQKGEITVNGVVYNQIMPASSALKDLEIAEIATYIANSWGNKSGLVEVKHVQDVLGSCQSKSY